MTPAPHLPAMPADPSADPGAAVPGAAPALTWRERLALLVRGVLLIALMAFAALAIMGEERPLETGQPAPPAHLTSLDGRSWDLSVFEGRPVLVNFWATWCPPCRSEIPTLVGTARAWENRVWFVMASVDSPPAEILDVIRAEDIPFPVAAVDGDTVRLWKASALPSTYLLDREHRVVWSTRGAVSPGELEEALSRYLEPEAAPPEG